MCLVVSAIDARAQVPRPDVNSVESVRSVGRSVEIELHSSREFPVRDEVVVLRIGKKEFSRSRPPEDGSLNTLIFILPVAEFDALPDGAPLTVKYGRQREEEGGMSADSAADHGPRWDFGKLNKAMRQ
jgi:hypothetical protein